MDNNEQQLDTIAKLVREQQLERIAQLLQEQNKLLSRLGIVATRIAGILLTLLVLLILAGVLSILF